MKKFILAIIGVTILGSCKKETNDPVKEETAKTTADSSDAYKDGVIPTYYGLGEFNNDRKAIYYVSLPASVHADVRTNVSYMRVGSYIFIQLNIPDTTKLTNPNNDILRLDFDIPNFNSADKTLIVKTWHDQVKITNLQDAEDVINNDCPNKLIPFTPKQCGNGVLTKQ